MELSIPSTQKITALTEAVMDEAAERYVEAFIAKVPSYTGVSRGQLAGLAKDVGVYVRGSNGNSGLDGSIIDVEYQLPHFLINEKYNATKWGFNLTNPGPYHAVPAAEAAAQEVIDQAAEELMQKILGGITWLK